MANHTGDIKGERGGSIDPLAILRTYEGRAITDSTPMPVEEEPDHYWEGIHFSIRGINFVVPMTEIAEVIHMPEITPVPRSQQWHIGLANIRNILIPVSHLHSYLKDEPAPTSINNRLRLMIIKCQCDLRKETPGTKEVSLRGMLVDNVFGVRSLTIRETSEEVPNSCPDFVRPFAFGSINMLDHGEATIVSLAAIAKEERFDDAAA